MEEIFKFYCFNLKKNSNVLMQDINNCILTTLHIHIIKSTYICVCLSTNFFHLN